MYYIPPLTTSCSNEDFESMIKDTCEGMTEFISKSDNLIMMEYFNCKEIFLEEWTIKDKRSWRNMIL